VRQARSCLERFVPPCGLREDPLLYPAPIDVILSGWTRFCITTFTTAPLVAFVTDMALYMIASECRLSTSSRANLDFAIQVVYTISL
jgi:hypothetical protein